MPSRTLKTTWPAPTQNSAIFNALIYGYAGDSSFTPRTLIPSPTMWWDDDRVDATVSSTFVSSKLRPDEQRLLDQPLVFGDGLTDDTYLEWILERSKRLFLILVDIGVPEQIFGVTDDSWDDSDLPITREAVERLRLSYDNDESLNKRFYKRQFAYMMQEINHGDHIDYQPQETVPLEPLTKRPGVAFYHSSEKVFLPSRPETIITRRRVCLDVSPSKKLNQQFKEAVDLMKSVSHEHIVSVFASYTLEGYGYLLSTPATEFSLRSFIQLPPQHFRNYPKRRRQQTLLNWIYCLGDALSFLHHQGLSHQNIRPTSIVIDSSENILLGEIGAFEQLMGDKIPNRMECYEYGAPEKFVRAMSDPSSSSRADGHLSMLSSQLIHTAGHTTDMISDWSPTDSRPPSSHGPILLSQWRDIDIDHQRSDTFSLGCVYLDILTFLMNRKSAKFSSHRSAKNRTPGRGGGQPDASFHANLGRLESWTRMLEKRATKKDSRLMHAVPPILHLCERMLLRDPLLRPTIPVVEEALFDIMAASLYLPSAESSGDNSDKDASIDLSSNGDAESVSVAASVATTSKSSSSSSSLTTIRVKMRGWHTGTVH